MRNTKLRKWLSRIIIRKLIARTDGYKRDSATVNPKIKDNTVDKSKAYENRTNNASMTINKIYGSNKKQHQ
jgi:hypothetical protein